MSASFDYRPKFVDIRAKYVAHIEKTLTLAGQSDGAAKARRILAIEP